MAPKTILVADDEAHILHVVSLKLQNAGYNIVTARDGEEALETVSSMPVDIIITDYQMPGLTGLELAQKVHQKPGKRNLPIILLTAHGMGIEQIDLARAGIAACLSKPFSPREVLAKVHALLEEAAARTASPDEPVSVQNP